MIAQQQEPPPNTRAFLECDTNADTCCLGKNFIISQYSTRTADVYAYDKSYKPIENVPIVTGVTAYDDKRTGETYILVFHESLYYGSKLDHSLINPNQLRHYGIEFNDNPYDREKGLNINVNDEVIIAMQAYGTKVRCETRVPTEQELLNCEHVVMTSPTAWEPDQVIMQETNVYDQYAPQYVFDEVNQRYSYNDLNMDESFLHEIDPCLTSLRERTISKITVSHLSTNENTDDVPSRRTFVSKERHANITAETLSENFGIGPERAKATLRATTQRGTKSAILPIARRYRADRMFDVPRLRSKFATDTIWADTKSLRLNVASQIYTHKCGLNAAYHMPRANGENVGNSLNDFIHEFGAPEHLTFDGAAVQVGSKTKFVDTLRRNHIRHHTSAPRRPNENPAEGSIRELKKKWYRIQAKRNVPNRLWDYGITWVCETGNVTSISSRYAKARTPIEIITGETPDITEYLDFTFYDWVTFKNNAGVGHPELGRWLGVSHRVGPLLSYWILPKSGIPISCNTVQKLTNLEQATAEIKTKMDTFTTNLEGKFNTISADASRSINDVDPKKLLGLHFEDEDFLKEYHRVINSDDLQEIDNEVDESIQGEATYTGMELGLPRKDDGALEHAIVKRRALDVEGKPIGKPNMNPILDSRQYEVEFLNGDTEILTANTIAENLLAQVDEEGHRQMLLDEIIDHCTLKDAIPISEGTFCTSAGTTRKKRTTRGWEICVRWKDGSTDWIALKDLKDSYPIELAEYATINKIEKEPSFAWWVPHVFKKRHRIISKLKSKYWQRTHKYGI